MINREINEIFLVSRCERLALAMEDEGERGLDENYLLVKVHVPDLNVQKCLQFPRDQLVWDVKQQCLAALPKVSFIITSSSNFVYVSLKNTVPLKAKKAFFNLLALKRFSSCRLSANIFLLKQNSCWKKH